MDTHIYTTISDFSQALSASQTLLSKNIPNKIYHESLPGYSSSQLKVLDTNTPESYLYGRENPTPPNEAMQIGEAFHVLTLEPELFAGQFVVTPAGFTLRSNENKKKWADWIANGITPLKYEKHEMIQCMAESVRGHQGAVDLLTGGEPELSMFWKDPNTEMQCKCRADVWNPTLLESTGACALVDLKSCQSANPREFAKSCRLYGYDLQAAFYLDGFRQIPGNEYIEFYFIAVEKTPPYQVAIYKLSQDDIIEGRKRYQQHLRTFKWCEEFDTWPGYPDEPTELTLNRY